MVYFEDSISTGLELTTWVRLACQQAPGICLVLLPQHLTYKQELLLKYRLWGTELRACCLQDRLFIN